MELLLTSLNKKLKARLVKVVNCNDECEESTVQQHETIGQYETSGQHDEPSGQLESSGQYGTFDVVKHGEWMQKSASRERRMALSETALSEDCQRVEEKTLLQEIID